MIPLRRQTRKPDTLYNIDLVFAFIFTLMSVIPILGPVKVVGGLLVTTFIPGYVMGLCIFPRQSQLTEVERWGLALVVSTCLAMFLPFILSAAGVRISAESYSISSSSIIGFMFFTAVIRRRRVPQLEMYYPGFIFSKTFVGMCGFALAVAVLVSSVVQHNLIEPPSFYVTSETGTFRPYPFDVIQGQELTVELHLTNPTAGSFEGNVQARDENGVFFREKVVVPPKATKTIPCRLPSKTISTLEKVTFTFYSKQNSDSRMLTLSYHVVNR